MCDFAGNVQRVIKVAFGVNERTLRSQTESSFMHAVDRSMAVIKLDLRGQVINANSNFLKLMGFVLEVIRGRHHQLLCRQNEILSEGYRVFWSGLKRGEFSAGVFPR